MKLIPLELTDIDLYMDMFTDANYMAELGGPQSPEKVPGILQKQIDCYRSGKGLVFKIVPEEDDWVRCRNLSIERGLSSPANPFYDFHADNKWKNGIGSVCLWFYEDIPEIGYGVLPRYQNFGFTTSAVNLLLQKAREEKERWSVIHAMTSVTNTASNRLLQKLGFSFIEETIMDYDSRKIPANHYSLPL